MSHAPVQARRLPSRWGYVIAAVIFVVSVAVATGFSVTGARQVARSLDVEPLDATAQVTVGEEPLAVYVDRRRLQSRCVATPAAGGDASSFDTTIVDYDVSAGGRRWDQVATSPEGLSPGTYTLSCNPTESAVATAPSVKPPTYGTGPALRFGHVAVLFSVALGVGAIGVIAAIILAIVTAVRRSQAKRPPPPYQGPPAYGS